VFVRRLDRYLGMFFVWHFLLSLVAVVVLYVVIDTFAKLEDFIEQEGVLEFIRWVVVYHAYQVPVLLTHFFPLVTLLAGVISVSRLARYNELNAIKAVGVSLHRALAPVFLCSLAIGVLSAANQEFVVPHLAHGFAEVRTKVGKRETYKDLQSYDPSSSARVWVRQLEYAIPGFDLKELETRPKAGAGSGPRLRATRGVWVDHWVFLWEGEERDAGGRWLPFEHRALKTAEDATTHTMPRKPKEPWAKAPEVRLQAERNGQKVELVLRTWEYRPAMRLILGGQLTAPMAGGDVPPPIAIHAAVWRGGEKPCWAGQATTYRMRGDRRDEVAYDGGPLPLAIPPHELIKSEADPALKSFRELVRPRVEPPAVRQKRLVILHNRLAFPLASLVLLLVGIPLMFQQEGGKSTWVGLGLALVVSVAFYFVNYVSQLAGQEQGGLFASVPALAAWLPILGFAGLGCFLMARMNT